MQLSSDQVAQCLSLIYGRKLGKTSVHVSVISKDLQSSSDLANGLSSQDWEVLNFIVFYRTIPCDSWGWVSQKDKAQT